MMTAGFENVVETYDVTLNICIQVFYTVAHSSLCSKIDYYVKLVFSEESANKRLVCNISFDELIIDCSLIWVVGFKRKLTILFYLLQAVFLEGNIVVIIEVIKTNDGALGHVFKKAHHKVGSYEASGASNKYFHGLIGFQMGFTRVWRTFQHIKETISFT